jgi:hypothetical protein
MHTNGSPTVRLMTRETNGNSIHSCAEAAFEFKTAHSHTCSGALCLICVSYPGLVCGQGGRSSVRSRVLFFAVAPNPVVNFFFCYPRVKFIHFFSQIRSLELLTTKVRVKETHSLDENMTNATLLLVNDVSMMH